MMQYKKKKFISGFTLLELMIVLITLSILATVITLSFSKLGTDQSLDKATITIISVLNEAKSNAVSSKYATSFGVRIDKNKITSFRGSYNNSNVDYTLSGLVTISTSTGIGNDIIFQNVSGNTNASGTITVSLVSDPTKKTVIQVFGTGAIQKN